MKVDRAAAPTRPPAPVVLRGQRLTVLDRLRILAGAQVVLHSHAGETLAALDPIRHLVRDLWITALRRIDLSPLIELPRLESLSVQLDRPSREVDLSRSSSLRRVALNRQGWVAAGSAISAPRVDSIAVWTPESALFVDHRTRATNVRLALCRRIRTIPPFSAPERVTRLWIQEIPHLDLEGVERMTELRRLAIEDAKQLTGVARLLSLPNLRELVLDGVDGIDDPGRLGELRVARLHQASSGDH